MGWDTDAELICMNQAIVIQAPGEVLVRGIPMPKRNHDETILRLLWGGICGSDLGTYHLKYRAWPVD
ncbi:hypothetical protein FACS1894158_08840 [Betaproteobacteria bacterium]|nr:hypothetical protein FACS1894158_08840 [Betaproteobacteria bacterium]